MAIMNKSFDFDTIDTISELAFLADRLQTLFFDFYDRYFNTADPNNNLTSAAKIECHYKVMQYQVSCLCDFAYDIHKGLDKLQDVEEEGEL